MLPLESSDSFASSANTILHRSKYLAVSAGLNRIVSVRNSISLWKGVTLYFSPRRAGLCSDFPLAQKASSYPIPATILYPICIFISNMLYYPCECEVRLTFIVNNISAAKKHHQVFFCFQKIFLFIPFKPVAKVAITGGFFILRLSQFQKINNAFWGQIISLNRHFFAVYDNRCL